MERAVERFPASSMRFDGSGGVRTSAAGGAALSYWRGCAAAHLPK